MVVNNNIDKLAEELERQELEVTDGSLSPQVYSQLLAIYLYKNDLCNAKYLWKRIPAKVKTKEKELGQIWAVGQQMWKRDFPAIYKDLNAVKWSEPVNEIMTRVHDNVRARAVNLIAHVYSSIALQMVAEMTGLSAEVAGTACLERGWVVENDTQMVHPIIPPASTSIETSSEDQLYKLTDFVSFLEN